MTLHHSFNFENFKDQCLYCSSPLSGMPWQSFHDGAKMYKAVECPCCSKKVSIPVSFLGSGHDSWDKTHTWMRNSDIAFRKPKRKIKELEAKIKILSEKTYNKFN